MKLGAPDAERALSVPNLLSLSRIVLAGAVWMPPMTPGWLLAMVALAAATDVLDGRVARARRKAAGKSAGPIDEAHAIGAWLDPLCDKIFILSVLAAVLVVVQPGLGIVALIALRDVVVGPLAVIYGVSPGLRRRLSFDFRAGVLGKLTTSAQLAAITSLLLVPRATLPLALLAAAAGAAAAIQYVARAVRSWRLNA